MAKIIDMGIASPNDPIYSTGWLLTKIVKLKPLEKKMAKKKTAPTVEVVTPVEPTADPVDVVEDQKMDPKIKALWVADLRSGKYPQTTGKLKELYIKAKGDIKVGAVKGYCCLGVLTDRFIRSKANTTKAKWEKETQYNIDTGKDSPTGQCVLDAEDTALAPDLVINWAGLESEDPSVPLKELWKVAAYKAKLQKGEVKLKQDNVTLALLNDIGFTFKQIADIIEKYL